MLRTRPAIALLKRELQSSLRNPRCFLFLAAMYIIASLLLTIVALLPIVLIVSRFTLERFYLIEDPMWFYRFFSPLIAFYTTVKYGHEADVTLYNPYWLANEFCTAGISAFLFYRARRHFQQIINGEYL